MAGERIPAAYVQLSDLPDDIIEGVLRHIDPDIFETYSLLLAAATVDCAARHASATRGHRATLLAAMGVVCARGP